MNVIERIHMLKKILKEAENIVAWQEAIYTALHNIHADWVVSGRFGMSRMPDMALDKIMVGQGAGNNPVEQDMPTARLKAGSVTDTTTAAGLISVTFAEAFASTPVVMVQIENDVDYYPVMISRSTTGFTVKILKTAHVHSQSTTGAEATHTHGISLTSGAGSSHKHSNPYTDYESSHTHGISFTSGAGSSHRHSNPNTSAVSAGTPAGSIGYEGSHTHSQGVTGGPSATVTMKHILGTHAAYLYAADTSGGSPTTPFSAVIEITTHYPGSQTHTHTNPITGAGSSHKHSFTGSALPTHQHTIPDTGYESSHTHSISGTSGAGSSHRHTVGDTGTESAHTHAVSGASGAGSSHSHSNPNTDSANAGNTLANTAVTFSYIAMVP